MAFIPTPEEPPRVFCQVCGAENSSVQEYCGRCHQKLMVISGAPGESSEGEAFEPERGSDFSLDEHLLERISILEEAVKRTAETVQKLVQAVHSIHQRPGLPGTDDRGREALKLRAHLIPGERIPRRAFVGHGG